MEGSEDAAGHWIPAEELREFRRNIAGLIEVTE